MILYLPASVPVPAPRPQQQPATITDVLPDGQVRVSYSAVWHTGDMVSVERVMSETRARLSMSIISEGE